MKIKLVIFDMDGVLVDACEWHRIALNEALQEVSNYKISLHQHYNIFNGLPTRTKLKMLAEQGLIKEEDIKKIESLKQFKTIQIIKNECFLQQEKINLLNYLKTKNILIGCCTNSIKETTHLILKKTGIFDKLDIIVTNEDVREPKPSPEGYNKIINNFNLLPNQVVIIEDSPKGIQAANKTGANVYTVKNSNEINLELLMTII